MPMKRSATGVAVCLLAFGLQFVSGQTNYQKIASFGAGSLTGSNTFGALIERGGRLYGTTRLGGSAGGSSGGGTVFGLNQDGTDTAVLHSFAVGFQTNATDGVNPIGPLLNGSDGMLYGTTPQGIAAATDGTIFRLGTNGSGYAIIYTFSNAVDATTGRFPGPKLAQDANGKLYGFTAIGGANDYGTIFRVNGDGSGFSAVYHLSDSTVDGVADFFLSGDGMLYGASYFGGSDGSGTLFKVSTNGTGFMVLRHFSGSGGDGSDPRLTEGSDGRLYGTVYNGLSLGVVFRIDKNGANYTVLHTFAGGPDDGAYPYGVIEGTNGMLYGVTFSGGGDDAGTILKLNKDGSGYSVLHHFRSSGGDGRYPETTLVQGSDGAFYGKTTEGGDADAGVVFRLSGAGDDTAARLAIDDVTAPEGNSGTRNFVFSVTLSRTNDMPVTVDYRTTNGTAIAGSDYVSTNGILTFSPGETNKTISVAVNGDTQIEPDETFRVVLSNPGNAVLSVSQGTATIDDDDAPPGLLAFEPFDYPAGSLAGRDGGVGWATAWAGSSNMVVSPGKTYTNAGYELSVSGNALGFGGFNFGHSRDLSALLGTNGSTIYVSFIARVLSSDYAGVSCFNGSTEQLFMGKTVFQNTWGFLRSGFGNDLSTASVTNETFLVYRLDFSGANVTVRMYVNPPLVAEPVAADIGPVLRSAFTFDRIRLGSGLGPVAASMDELRIGTNWAAIAPIGRVAPVSISINNVARTEGNAGTTIFPFNVLLSRTNDVAVMVNFSTIGGTASPGSDYMSTNGTLTFNPGKTNKTISIVVNGDTAVELDEAFGVVLTNAVNAVINNGAALGTVLNDDVLVLAFGPDGFQITLTGLAGLPHVVEASTDLITWIPIGVATASPLNSQIRFLDRDSIIFPRRFYRFRSSMNGVPVIDLTTVIPGMPPDFPDVAGPQEPPKDDALGDAACVEHPVVLNTSEVLLSRNDLTIPGRGDLDFRLERVYRSGWNFDGPLGHNWTGPLFEVLQVQGNGDVRRANGSGHVDLWVRQINGSFVAPRGFFGTLIRDTDGRYILRFPDGSRCHYRNDGRLLAKEDRFSNRMLFKYDAEGNLSQVLDVYGRIIQFIFETAPDGIKRLTRARDFANREVVYSYDANGNLISARSPIVTGTTTGNDFPNGRTETYAYTAGAANAALNHNLVSVTAPQEVAVGGPPFLQFAYGTNPGDALTFDKVISQVIGGTNASGIGAGGTKTFVSMALNAGSPPDPTLPRLKVTVTDRNGNVCEHYMNETDFCVAERKLTRGLRPAEPAFYETTREFNIDGLLTKITMPEGNRSIFTYDSGPNRGSHRNVIEVRHQPDAARGGGADLVTTYTYEPLCNRVASTTDPRGNYAGFIPPMGTASADRYTTYFFHDFQEGTQPIADATQFNIDLTGWPRGLGDLNGDGITNQAVGNVVKTTRQLTIPRVTILRPPAEGTNVVITYPTNLFLNLVRYNNRGQPTELIDGEGNLTVFEYYPENDPDGDGANVPLSAQSFAEQPRGYLKAVIVDAGLTPQRTATNAPAMLRRENHYNGMGWLTRRVDARGVSTDFEVNALGEQVREIRGADVSRAVILGQLITTEPALTLQTRFHRDHNGQLTRKEVENRNLSTPGVGPYADTAWIHDILGNGLSVTEEVTASSIVTQFRYDANENKIEVTKPEGNRDRTLYDERDLVFQVTQGFGSVDAATVQFDYDRNGNRVRYTDAYDSDGVGGREITTYIYDGFDRLISALDPLNGGWQNTYDPASQRVRAQFLGHPAGNPAGALVLLREFRFDIDEAGRTFRIHRPQFVSGQFPTVRPPVLRDFDNDGVLTEVMEYDNLSRLVRSANDLQQVTTYIYDGASRPVVRLDAAGNRVTTVFDNNGNPVKETRLEVASSGLALQEQFVEFYVYDQLDRLIRATDNAKQTTYYAYDSRDNLIISFDAKGAAIFDPWGLLTGQINGPGNPVFYTYDGRDRMISRNTLLFVGGAPTGPPDMSNPLNPDGAITVKYFYDGNDRLIAIGDDSNNTTSFGYNQRDEQISQTNADGRSATVQRNSDGEVINATDFNGSVKTYARDRGGRVIQIDISRAAGVVGTTQKIFRYTGLDDLVESIDDNGGAGAQTVRNVWSSTGDLLEEQQNGRAISRERDCGCRDRSLTLANGRRIDFGLHSPNNLVGDLRESGVGFGGLSYMGPCPYQRPAIINYGNLTTRTVSYRADGLAEEEEVSGPFGFILHHTGDRDRGGRILQETRHTDLGLADSADYNSAGWTVSARYDYSGGAPAAARRSLDLVDFSLSDGVGNLRTVVNTFRDGSTQTVTRQTDAVNQYTDVSGTPRSHNANGDLTSDNIFWFFEWDADDRLVRSRRLADSQQVAFYLYFADGRRAQKIVRNPDTQLVVEDTRYFWNGGQVVEEQNAAGQTTATYVWNPNGDIDELFQFQRTASHPLGAGNFYVHYDIRGNVTAVTDDTGAVVERRRYEWFGATDYRDPAGTQVATSPSGLRYGFHGREFDSETGLYYFRARYYDPTAGRFISRDPVWDEGNHGNQYTFAGNDPASQRDPLGLDGSMGTIEAAKNALDPDKSFLRFSGIGNRTGGFDPLGEGPTQQEADKQKTRQKRADAGAQAMFQGANVAAGALPTSQAPAVAAAANYVISEAVDQSVARGSGADQPPATPQVEPVSGPCGPQANVGSSDTLISSPARTQTRTRISGMDVLAKSVAEEAARPKTPPSTRPRPPQPPPLPGKNKVDWASPPPPPPPPPPKVAPKRDPKEIREMQEKRRKAVIQLDAWRK